MAEWVDVAEAQNLPPGAHMEVWVDGTAVALFNIDGTLYAIENRCTHDGGTLTGGSREGMEIVCPRHGARFSIATGEVLEPPAYEPLETFPVRVVNGVLQVSLDE